MSAHENEAIARRFLAEQDRLKGAVPAELCAEHYTATVAGFGALDRAGQEQLARTFWAAIPDLVQRIDEVTAGEDRVAVRYTAAGTHQGDLMGVPPTGTTIEIAGVSTFRIVDGKIEEAYCLLD